MLGILQQSTFEEQPETNEDILQQVNITFDERRVVSSGLDAMGAANSIQQPTEADPQLQPLQTQQHREENVLEARCIQGCTFPEKNKDEEAWMTQIKELGKTIECLAGKNMKLLAANKLVEDKYKEERKQDAEQLARFQEEAEQSLQMLEKLQEENKQMKQCIEKHAELQKITAQNQDTLIRLTQNEEKYEKEITDLKNKLQFSESQKLAVERTVLDLNSELKDFKCKYEDKQQEIEKLESELFTERKYRQELSQENRRLIAEHECNKSYTSDETSAADRDVQEQQTCQHEVNGACDEASNSGTDLTKKRSVVRSAKATAELEMFREQMKSKREARHQALSAISNEMERLRGELSSEREARHRAVEELEEIKRSCAIQRDDHTPNAGLEQLQYTLNLEKKEKEQLRKEILQLQKFSNEEKEQLMKEIESEKENVQHIADENKHLKEQLEESDQLVFQKSGEIEEIQCKLKSDNEKYQNQISALKEVIAISKQMLHVRENQVAQLKRSLHEIETSVVQRQHGTIMTELKGEYESQIQNIKSLKALYEDRMSIMEADKDKLVKEHEEVCQQLESARKQVNLYEIRIKNLESSISERNDTVSHLQDELSDSLDQSRNLSNELTLINNMFTQMLIGNDMDLDKLIKLLQENHDLITEMTIKEDCDETAASLPKLLLDLISQINKQAETQEENENALLEDGASSTKENINLLKENNVERNETENETNQGILDNGCALSAQEIASNLPKVWKVLLELISHHVVPASSDQSSEDGKNCCYKTVNTPYGPRLVISVSKTFIRLKDLILEKKSLQKELTHLKQLNGHLESKLLQQEQRLSLVSTELHKTWNVVGRMRTQHQQLHTHEKILRYELQQKRKLLTELKQELEYCKEKWEDARKKNSQSEAEWKKLRKEFAMRKKHPEDSLNNSVESGYSDEKGDDSGEDDGQAKSLSCIGKVENSESDIPRRSEYFELLPVSTHESNVDESAELSCSSSPNSLPDLVSVSGDVGLTKHKVTSLPLLLDSQSFPEPNLQPSKIDEDNIQSIPGPFTSALHLDPGNAIQNDSEISPSDYSTIQECSTISLVTLLKQQLSCFSQNLEMITSSTDFPENVKAIQSIFSLPAIQIPAHLYDHLIKEDQACSLDKSSEIHSQCFDDINTNCSKLVESSTGEHKTGKLNIQSPSEEFDEPSSSNKTNISENEECAQHSLPIIRGTNTETSGVQCSSNGNRSQEEILDARAARLRRLEEQCQQLFHKVTQTTNRSTALSNRLEELHEQYGNDDGNITQRNHNQATIPKPPDLPTELPSVRLPTEMEQPPDTERKKPCANPEQAMELRAARLKRLEEQCKSLFSKVTRTTQRSTEISNQLDRLHEHYGNGDTAVTATSLDASDVEPLPLLSNNIPRPPPLPHVLPSTRLPTYEEAGSSNNCPLTHEPDSQESSVPSLEEAPNPATGNHESAEEDTPANQT